MEDKDMMEFAMFCAGMASGLFIAVLVVYGKDEK